LRFDLRCSRRDTAREIQAEEISEMSIMLVAAIVGGVLLVAAIGGRLTVSARRGSGHDFGEMNCGKARNAGNQLSDV
jgi:hypothetical protein